MDTRVDNFQPEAEDLLEDSYLDQKYNPGKYTSTNTYIDDDMDIPIAPELDIPRYSPIKEDDKLVYSSTGRSPAPGKKSWSSGTASEVPPSGTPSSTQVVP